MKYDSEQAQKNATRLWRSIAKVAEKKALENAERGFASSALEMAIIAEAAYWQATGDIDPSFIGDLRAKHGT